MAQIQAPDGSIVEFPDGTDDATIISVMKKNFGQGQTPPEQSGWHGDHSALGLSGNAGSDLASIGAGLLRGIGKAGEVTAGGILNGANMVLPESMQLGKNPVGQKSMEAAAAFPSQVGQAVSGAGHFVNGAVADTLRHSPLKDYMKMNPQDVADADNVAKTMQPFETVGGIAQAAYDKPVTSLANASAMFTGGAGLAARAPMLGGKAGLLANGLRTASEFTNPVNVIGKPIKAGSKGFANMLAPKITPERQKLIDILDSEGVSATAGQKTGNDRLRYAESMLGGGKMQNVIDAQGEQFTKAALNRAGIDSMRASPKTMSKGFTDIGNKFDELGKRNNLIPDVTLAKDISGSVTDYANNAPQSMQPKLVGKLANDILTASQNGMTGTQYNAFTSELGEVARSAGSNDPHLRDVYYGLKSALDDAMERSIAQNNPTDLGEFRDVRNKYRNILVLEKAANGAGENAAQGLINPSALRNATVQKHGLRNYATGEGDFADLARAGEGVLKPVPNSGTAQRILAAGVPSALAAGLVNPVAGMTGLVAAMAPYVSGKALMSKPIQKLLSSGSKKAKPFNDQTAMRAMLLQQIAAPAMATQQ
jgi:hypothetical protein